MGSKPTRLRVYREGKQFIVDPVNMPGSPSIGRGTTLLEAYGSFFIEHQKALGIEVIDVEPSAQAAEVQRRKDALSSR